MLNLVSSPSASKPGYEVLRVEDASVPAAAEPRSSPLRSVLHALFYSGLVASAVLVPYAIYLAVRIEQCHLRL